MTDEVMTIREMCDEYDVTPRTLRFYESKELLAPIRQGSKRLFTRRDRARLKLILRGKKFGFSLEEIRQILDLYESDGGEQAQLKRAHDAAKERLSEMERQRDELSGTIEELKSEIEWSANVLTSYSQQAAAE
ncbi:MerR family transcriptional regulator [Psychromarinibacter sp. S121]|uniref:MerR family transcriptional regulator n=1 Tax=Psychromarinibacter sp. S121 TaxID=3415127 RepID=UPI003C7E1D21